MTNVGSLIPTPSGLRTVVQVLPEQTVPPSSQVVTLPISDANDSFPPIDYFGTPLPGQAQSAASFVQTLVMPGDGGTADSANTETGSTAGADSSSSGIDTTADPATVITAPTTSFSADTSGNSDTASTVGETTSTAPTGQTVSPPPNPAAKPDAYAHAASAYQTTQQRGSGQEDHHRQLIG